MKKWYAPLGIFAFFASFGLLFLLIGSQSSVGDEAAGGDVVDIIADDDNPQARTNSRPNSPYITPYPTASSNGNGDEAQAEGPTYQIALTGDSVADINGDTVNWDYEEPQMSGNTIADAYGLYTLTFHGEDTDFQLMFTEDVTTATYPVAAPVENPRTEFTNTQIFAQVMLDDTAYNTTTGGEVTFTAINETSISGTFQLTLESVDDDQTITADGTFRNAPIEILEGAPLDDSAGSDLNEGN